MAKPVKRGGGKNSKDNARRGGKKKISILTQEKIDYVDWTDVNLMRRFISDRAKIRSRRVTGNSQQQQNEIAMAVKNAREMALIPYSNRITTQRGGGGGRNRRDDSRSQDGPLRPSSPPPRPGGESEEGGDASAESAPAAAAPAAAAPETTEAAE